MFKVLLIDDEEWIIDDLKKLIDWESCGFEICATATDAQSAIAAIFANSPHLIITDIKMPDYDGVDLLKFISENKINASCAVLSAYDSFEYAQQAIRSGATDYFLKPIEVDALVSFLNRIKPYLQQLELEKQTLYKEKDKLESEVFEFILKNYNQKISISALAERFYMSPYQIEQLFKEKFGTTIKNYLMTLRIKNACKLLKNTSMSVNEISISIGYDDYSYFSKIFKKAIGVSPSDYRNN